MFISSLFLGGALGAVITLILGMSVPAVMIGALIGACIAWVAYDPVQIVRKVPDAFQATVDTITVASPKLGGWSVDATRFVLRPRLPLYVFAGMAYAAYRSRFWEWSDMARGVGVTVIGWHCIVAWWVTGSAMDDLEVQKTGPLMRRLGVPNHRGFLISFLKHTALGAAWTRRDIRQQLVDTPRFIVAPYVIAVEVVMYAVGAVGAIALATAMVYVIVQLAVLVALVVLSCIYSYKLFILVHSEKRRMVFVDSGLGVLVSYATLRMQFGTAFVQTSPLAQLSFVLLGGACAVLLGVVNYEVVSRRVLKLNPV